MSTTVPASVPEWLRVPQRLFQLADPSASRETFRHPATVASHRRTQVVVAAIIAVASIIILLLAAPAEARSAGPRLDATERKVVKLVNRYRARHGRPRLRVNRRLNRVADRHSREMARHNFFAHASRNGTRASTRVRRSTRASVVGENLAFLSSRRGAAQRVVRMWIRSPGHRAVMLNRSFQRIGVGRRTGRLGGSRGSHFTADFASRR